LAAILSLQAGPSFHFVLNDTVYSDNRIPPRGFTNAGFEAIQSPPVAYAYADGQHWDVASYFLPATAETAHVALRYQTLSKEYVEFLRDANVTNTAGQDLYDAWAAHGKSAPVTMVEASVALGPLATAVDETRETRLSWALEPGRPNPFRFETTIAFSLAAQARVRVTVHDLAGRRVRMLVDGVLDADRHEVRWDGRDDGGRALASGVYFVRYEGGPSALSRKVVLLN
ncbi:MAG: FlgD immunoglobulin-like domain containing protein, partial [bacterium]